MVSKKFNFAVIKYGAGNLGSISNFLELNDKIKFEIVEKPSKLKNMDGCIIPGVGHFGKTSKNLHESGLSDEIKSMAAKSKLIIGICIGAQLLLESSEESPNSVGLGLIEGTCKSLKGFSDIKKLPRVGWNYVEWLRSVQREIQLDKNTTANYFVHSYQLFPKNHNLIVATSVDKVCATIRKKNIWGFQFHPEKSQRDGFNIFNGVINTYA